MTQNIYDDPGFFEAYGRLPRSVEGLAAAPEWPSLQALLPPMAGLRVIDLGCGYGWFCRWARENGAAGVVGIDVSEKMLARAKSWPQGHAIDYRRADLETLDLPAGAFDLAYSSLALHYLANLDGLVAAVHRALVSEGRFVFSMEHPIFTAPKRQGWRKDEEARPYWPVESYLVEGARTTNWLAEGVVKQHRTLATVLNLLIRSGFAIRHVEEWGPDDALIAAKPEWAADRERPIFLLVSAEKVG